MWYKLDKQCIGSTFSPSSIYNTQGITFKVSLQRKKDRLEQYFKSDWVKYDLENFKCLITRIAQKDNQYIGCNFNCDY